MRIIPLDECGTTSWPAELLRSTIKRGGEQRVKQWLITGPDACLTFYTPINIPCRLLLDRTRTGPETRSSSPLQKWQATGSIPKSFHFLQSYLMPKCCLQLLINWWLWSEGSNLNQLEFLEMKMWFKFLFQHDADETEFSDNVSINYPGKRELSIHSHKGTC